MEEFLAFKFLDTEHFSLSVGQLIAAFFVLLVAKIFLLVAKRYKKKRTKSNPKVGGRYHSLFLILSYFVWVLAVLTAMQVVGIKLNVLLAGGAALLVGIGLGLQSLFHDFVSGVIILAEGTIEVGDVIEIDGILGKVIKITIRNSVVMTQNDYSIIIPNHFFVSEKVINWTHNLEESRFMVSVGVAYGSDTQKVIDILQSCPASFKEISKKNKPFARFEGFGESSLDFKLYFWCDDPFVVERVKGSLRLMIDKRFREEGITIPFPQRDLHIIQPKESVKKMLDSQE